MKKLLLIIAAALLATGCASTGGASAGAAAPKAKAEKMTYTFEAEDFKVTGGEVIDNPDGSGSKVVLVTDVTGNATFEAPVVPGTYVIEVWVNATDGDSDGLYVGINDGEEVRVYANTAYGSTVPVNQTIMKKIEGESVKIDLIFVEPLMIDKVVFKQK